jgi:hypothetical protein
MLPCRNPCLFVSRTRNQLMPPAVPMIGNGESISRFVQTLTFAARGLYFYCSRFRFLSSSLSSSSCSSSLSAVSAGLRMWAMLPLLVGGPELSLKRPVVPLSRELPHDQLLRWSTALPFEKGGVVGRELSVRPWEEAVVSE